MKNFTKVCLIAGGVCILIGGGITTVAAAMGGRLSDIYLPLQLARPGYRRWHYP